MSNKAQSAGSPPHAAQRRLIDLARREVEEVRDRTATVGGSSAGSRSEAERAATLPRAGSLSGYQIDREIHRGGQGVVFQALQLSTKRTVALKVMHLGPFAGPRDRARFEREVEILASLRHPNIVAIHDSGEELGQFYYVMDYVAGEPLDEYSRKMETSRGRKPEVERLLRLFAKICDAVNAAHLRGVIHRDLKPGNILIDGNGEPHVLDFGLARLARDPLCAPPSGLAEVTVAGQFVGSLPWASPEQAEGRTDLIDVRTDVYSLGVILYQLLTGRFPYSVNGTMREVLDNILTAEPSRPGTLSRDINDEIETILLKCLQKQRERRYQSAGELAKDIARYLAGELIEAKRDSGWYVLKKTLRRHRAVALVAAAFAVLSTGFALSMALQTARTSREADKALKVLAFLQNMLPGVAPENMGKGSITVREVLDHAAARLERELAGQPEVAAAIHHALGKDYSTLGFYAEAERHLRAAVDLRRALFAGDHLDLATALDDLAANLHDKREIAEAEGPTREALAMRRRLFGDESLEVAESTHRLAALLAEEGRESEAEPLIRKALDIRRQTLGPEHESVASSIAILGWCLKGLGKLDEAEAAMRDAVDLERRLDDGESRTLAARLTFLSDVLRAKGDFAGEEKVVREAIQIRRKQLGEEHPALAWNLFCLARVRRRLGDLAEAETACRQALEIQTKKRGPDHPDIADCQQLLAQIYDDQERPAEAGPLWRACLDMRRRILPPEDPEIALAENQLRANLAAQQAHGEAPERTFDLDESADGAAP